MTSSCSCRSCATSPARERRPPRWPRTTSASLRGRHEQASHRRRGDARLLRPAGAGVRRLVVGGRPLRGRRPPRLAETRCRRWSTWSRVCRPRGCSMSPAARAFSPGICGVRWWASIRARRWSTWPPQGCRTPPSFWGTRCRCHSPTASSTACSPAISTVTCCRTSAPPSSPRRGGWPANWSWSTRRCVRALTPSSGSSGCSTTGRSTACTSATSPPPNSADELGGGDVLHAGTWFVAVKVRRLVPGTNYSSNVDVRLALSGAGRWGCGKDRAASGAEAW